MSCPTPRGRVVGASPAWPLGASPSFPLGDRRRRHRKDLSGWHGHRTLRLTAPVTDGKVTVGTMAVRGFVQANG